MLRKIRSLVSSYDERFWNWMEGKSTSGPDVRTLPERSKPSGRGTEESSTSVASSSPENPFPDPWDGDWNDGVYIWQRINKERSL